MKKLLLLSALLIFAFGFSQVSTTYSVDELDTFPSYKFSDVEYEFSFERIVIINNIQKYNTPKNYTNPFLPPYHYPRPCQNLILAKLDRNVRLWQSFPLWQNRSACLGLVWTLTWGHSVSPLVSASQRQEFVWLLFFMVRKWNVPA